MLYNLLKMVLSSNMIVVAASAVACVTVFLLLSRPFAFLPKDGGKFVTDKDGNKVEVNANSNGKTTGVGLVFVSVAVLIALLFFPITLEFVLYMVLCLLMMIVGYLDDSSKAPWGELVKGILDLVLALAAAIVFVIYNESAFVFFGHIVHIPMVVYVILAVCLIWGSVNVTNCTDGVDGLCGTVSVIELFAISFIFGKYLGQLSGFALVMCFVLCAYLAYNWYPSTVLMGDAGSRTIGFLIALLAMKCWHPFLFVILSFVFLFDGGLGLLKLVIMRVTKKPFLEKIRFPFHDELKKNRKWSVGKIVIFFSAFEVIMCVVAWLIMRFTLKG